MASEHLLNYYYNIGGFNKPQRIGYMMNMIRRLKPLTMDEWEIWYLENIHDKEYIEDISIEMHESVPAQYGVTLAECRLYVYDVMFRRTFQGYNKEKVALRQLREIVSDKVQDAPKEWDTDYFIDFYIPEEEDHPMIGIQLKPETFYRGNYHLMVDIEGKMNRFRSEFNALAYVLRYAQSNGNDESIVYTNPEVIEEIRNNI